MYFLCTSTCKINVGRILLIKVTKPIQSFEDIKLLDCFEAKYLFKFVTFVTAPPDHKNLLKYDSISDFTESTVNVKGKFS